MRTPYTGSDIVRPQCGARLLACAPAVRERHGLVHGYAAAVDEGAVGGCEVGDRQHVARHVTLGHSLPAGCATSWSDSGRTHVSRSCAPMTKGLVPPPTCTSKSVSRSPPSLMRRYTLPWHVTRTRMAALRLPHRANRADEVALRSGAVRAGAA
eukprot:scaffold3630_cov306-Prasinococcus_capsulatus_cf.AAC.9